MIAREIMTQTRYALKRCPTPKLPRKSDQYQGSHVSSFTLLQSAENPSICNEWLKDRPKQ